MKTWWIIGGIAALLFVGLLLLDPLAEDPIPTSDAHISFLTPRPVEGGPVLVAAKAADFQPPVLRFDADPDQSYNVTWNGRYGIVELPASFDHPELEVLKGLPRPDPTTDRNLTRFELLVLSDRGEALAHSVGIDIDLAEEEPQPFFVLRGHDDVVWWLGPGEGPNGTSTFTREVKQIVESFRPELNGLQPGDAYGTWYEHGFLGNLQIFVVLHDWVDASELPA